jgi:hypothetical protein
MQNNIEEEKLNQYKMIGWTSIGENVLPSRVKASRLFLQHPLFLAKVYKIDGC